MFILVVQGGLTNKFLDFAIYTEESLQTKAKYFLNNRDSM